jgi:predicted transcriptional regulator of viral defense system
MRKELIMKKLTGFFMQNGCYARMHELKRNHFSTSIIKSAIENELIEKIKPGLYRLSDLSYPENISIGFMDVSKAIPGGIICLISALAHYELSTFNPSEVYIAIPNNSYAPKVLFPPVRIYYFRERFYQMGVDTIETEYGKIRIFNKEKTICDMFRYRNKLGEDMSLEALKEYIKQKNTDLAKLKRYAEICQVKTTLLPSLKAIVG